jgi:hypothetical protein
VPKESNVRSVGLPRLTGFEDRLGHRPRPLPVERALKRPEKADDDASHGLPLACDDESELFAGSSPMARPGLEPGTRALPARVGVLAAEADAPRLQQSDEAVRRWLEEIYPAIERAARRQRAEILWVDESGLRSDHTAGRSWAPIGRTRSPRAPASALRRT